MLNRKWLQTLTLAIFLLIPGVARAQLNTGGGRIVTPRNDSAAVVIASRINDRVGVVIASPRNASEFEKVYGSRPSRSEIVDMVKMRQRVGRLDDPVLKVQTDARTRSGLESYVKKSDERIIALVGHNVNGEFRFPDGSTQSLADIDALAKKHDKLAILLSCEAKDYVHQSPAATGSLTNWDALKMTAAVGKSLGQGPPSTNNPLRGDDLVNRVQADINGIERLSAIKLELKATAVVGTLGTGYLIEQRRKSKRR